MFFGLIKPNDWKIIHKEKGSYAEYRMGYKISENKPYYAYLKYSKSRNKYKITCSDDVDDFENSNAYQGCLNKQIELETRNEY